STSGWQGLWLRASAFEQAKQIAVGGEDESGILGQDLAVCLHALEKIVELSRLRVLRVRLGINLGCFSIRFAPDLLHLPVGGRLNFVQVALLATGDASGFAFAFRAKARGNLLPFADHAL